MRGKVLVFVGANILLGCAGLVAQQAAPAVSDDYIQLVRKDLRSDKKQLVAANMSLTESEATKFWPVYDQYAADLTKINDSKLAVIREYAAGQRIFRAGAQVLVRRWNESDDAVIQLRLKYLQSSGCSPQQEDGLFLATVSDW
jgi:hypothetical protein